MSAKSAKTTEDLLDIPPFLRRTETPAERAERQRRMHAEAERERKIVMPRRTRYDRDDAAAGEDC